MKKVLCKSLSTLLAVILLFSAVPMLGLAADKNSSPVFTVDTVEETPTELVLKLSLTEGSFVCFDATITVDGLECKSIYTTDDYDAFTKSVKIGGGSAADCENPLNGEISMSVTKSCEAPMDILILNYAKTEAGGVNGSDVSFELTSCYISEDNKDVSVLDKATASVALPETHVHNEEWTIVKDSTCAEEGLKTSKCTICGLDVGSEKIDKKEHANTHEENLAAGCTTDGYHKVICDDCKNVIENETIKATGHGTTHVERKEATCTEPGYRKVICDVCKNVVSESVLQPRNHADQKTERVEPTCTKDGYVRTYCLICKETLSLDPLPMTGHSDETYTETKKATCTEDGYIKYFCSECNELIKTDVLKKTGHGELRIETKDVTCTEDGYVRYYCKTCGELTKENIIKSEGHKHVTDVQDATCHDEGHETVFCSVCHEIFSDKTTPKLKHEWTSWSTVKEPTYRSVGTSRRTCKLCGDYEDKEIPMVKVPVTSVKMSLPSISMNYKQTSRLYADVTPVEAAYSANIVWKSSNTRVCTVNEEGTITATGLGTAVITASTEDGKISDTCTVTVKYSWLQWIIVYILFGWIWYL